MAVVELDTLRRKPLTQIISLGPDCSVAYNLRRFFDFDTAMPFDWWIMWRQGLDGVLANPDPERIYDPTLLYLSEGRRTVLHRDLDIVLHHEFPREWSTPDQPVVENFADYIDQAKSKTAYLMRRFLSKNDSAERILFVRENSRDVWDLSYLDKIFADATWSFAPIEKIYDPSLDWKSDIAAWERTLRALDVTLDKTHHKAFQDIGAGHGDIAG